MYLVGTVPIEGGYTCDNIQVLKRSKKDAIAEYYSQIKEAFHGETVLCYNNSDKINYADLMPNVLVKKKTDARMGEDVDFQFMFGDENRKKFLKFKYLGKIKD